MPKLIRLPPKLDFGEANARSECRRTVSVLSVRADSRNVATSKSSAKIEFWWKSIEKTTMLATLLIVVACSGGFRDAVGLRRSAPDEFKVVSNAPLATPPEFTLRPPVPGAKRPQELDIEQQAKDILLDKSTRNKDSGESKGESAFLKRADIQRANPDIKNVLTQEELDAAKAEKKKGFLDKISSYASLKSDKEPVVSAAKEKGRIATNKKEGKPASDGEIVTVQPGSGGLLNNIFGF